ncbi:MalM family protein [Endozoicomonas arenosclerae]|uniref:MalM family protein n=1 Tax=Endozoicomonas arenosclerae TaxID=1633495 RepID=UPI000781DF8F|nr:MalM family protein [Endozoicomonas arenosclerae]
MKRLTLMLAVAVLSGCATQNNDLAMATPQVVEQKSLKSLNEVSYANIQVYEKAIRIERQISSETDQVSINGLSTPVAGWKLPDYGVYRFKLESLVQRTDFGTKAEAFMPEVWLLDKNFSPIQKLSIERMVYSDQSMLSREALVQEFIIDNRKERKSPPVYLALLTTEEAQKYSVKVANFDEEYARIRARTAPPTPDVFAVAANSGTLRLEVTPLISHSRLKTVKKAQRPDYVPATPELAKPKVATNTLSVSADYLTEVKSAIEAADIQTALALRENARQLHALLQKQFSQSYGQPSESIKLPGKPQSLSPEKTLNLEFERQLALEMKREDAQAALAIIDKAGALSRDIDELF